MSSFTEALESGAISSVAQVPKSDIHSHAGRAGSLKYLSEKLGISILPRKTPFGNLGEMQAWYDENVTVHTPGIDGRLLRYQAAFAHADIDGVAVLAMSFGLADIPLLGGIDSFIRRIDALHREYAPKTRFYPELSIARGCDTERTNGELDEVLQKNWFKSIDICNDEFAQPIKEFKKIYKKAQGYGLKLKAHVGEVGSAEDIREAVETLELCEVHHGISAAKSPEIMRWLAQNKIQLNICPASNIKLGIVESYERHPIRAIADSGVPVTINTDDLMIFDVSVSREYMNLFQKGVFSPRELDVIRQTGINSY